MLCKRPYVRVRDGLSTKVRVFRPDVDTKEGLPFGCGQCLACRINKRRQWSLRLLLEYTQHEKTAFVTLTYSPEWLPMHPDDTDGTQGVLCKRDVQLFLKKLRKKFSDRTIRYYCAGEYGPNFTKRPHYHLILFGVDASELDPDYFFFFVVVLVLAWNKAVFEILHSISSGNMVLSMLAKSLTSQFPMCAVT